jgi:DNA polymerase-4
VRARLTSKNVKGRTITIKVKYHDFTQITRSKSLDTPTNHLDELISVSKDLLLHTDLEGKKVRLLGISLSNFDTATQEQVEESAPQAGG